MVPLPLRCRKYHKRINQTLKWIRQALSPLRFALELGIDHVTFVATEIADIAFAKLIFVDGRYESADEILRYMGINAEQGKNIFLNPNVAGNVLFTVEAIALLKRHPTCQLFIEDYEKNAKQKKSLSKKFYKTLEVYLTALYRIGNKHEPWSFPESVIEECLVEKLAFFNALDAADQLVLQRQKISVPIMDGYPSEANFNSIARGEDPWDCVLTQQIYLWVMLCKACQSISIPNSVLRNAQVRNFDLEDFSSKKRKHEVNIESSFSGLKGKLSSDVNLKKKTVSSIPNGSLANVNRMLSVAPKNNDLFLDDTLRHLKGSLVLDKK